MAQIDVSFEALLPGRSEEVLTDPSPTEVVASTLAAIAPMCLTLSVFSAAYASVCICICLHYHGAQSIQGFMVLGLQVEVVLPIDLL